MTKPPLQLRVFVGFQADSEFHDASDFKTLMAKLSRQLKRQGISLFIQFGKFPPGTSLWTEVTEAIRRSEACIFDISENNPNVMIEVGLAHGFGCQVFLLKNKESTKHYRLPSDISSTIFVPYLSKDELDGLETLSDLKNGFEDFVARTHKPDYFYRSLWGFQENDSVTIICSELDKPEARMHPEPKEFLYLSKYGDLDALETVQDTLIKLYKNLRVTRCTGDEAKQRRIRYDGNLVLIGGPDYNMGTRLFEDYVPFEYKTGNGGDNDIYLREKSSGKDFHPLFVTKAGHTKITDYGYFLKMKNPHNSEKKVVMIGGAHTYGVYGAAKTFAFEGQGKDQIQYKNCSTIINNLGYDPDFCSLITVEAFDRSVDPPQVDLGLTSSL